MWTARPQINNTQMNYLYIDFPKTKESRDLSRLKKGDTIEVRVSELDELSIRWLFDAFSNVDCNKIEMTQVSSNDAYGMVQRFHFL